jgi:sec-independent protein translocase protein TatA
MEGKIGIWEVLLIVGIALLIFGPSKFASLGKSLGEGLRNFKASMREGEEPKKEEEKKP